MVLVPEPTPAMPLHCLYSPAVHVWVAITNSIYKENLFCFFKKKKKRRKGFYTEITFTLVDFKKAARPLF
jgi:hypothetical protein